MQNQVTNISQLMVYFDCCFSFTDLDGAMPAIGSPLAGMLFVVLGAGGAGKSLAYGAAQKGARVVVANRTFGKTLAFSPAFQDNMNPAVVLS